MTDDDEYELYRERVVLFPHHSTPDDGARVPTYWPKERHDDDDSDGATPG